MSIDARYVQVISQNLNNVANVMAVPPIHVGELRRSLIAADGWCAPSETIFEVATERLVHVGVPSWWDRPIREVKVETLACGCSMQVLESGWHEVGCKVVGGHLCRPVTKQPRAVRLLPVVAYEL